MITVKINKTKRIGALKRRINWASSFHIRVAKIPLIVNNRNTKYYSKLYAVNKSSIFEL